MKKKKLENYILNMGELLGAGSFGKVYKGYNDLTKQVIAAKVLDKKQVESDEYIRNAFFLEIKTMQKLKSKNIVRILDVLQTTHNYYLIQEYCNGKDLKSALREKNRFSQQEAISRLKDIMMGFVQLISHGVIHRDVKPQNILIHDGVLKIADFGFAKSVISNAQLNNTLVGTPLYMSPEQLKCEKYSSKCDIWAIGLIFYEMVCGKLPWKGRSEYELLKNILSMPLEFPKDIELQPNVKSFIAGCLKLQEKDRFSWDDLYCHPIFGNMFSTYSQKIKQFNHRARYALTKLRIQVHSTNIDIDKVLKQMKLDRHSKLDFQHFYDFLSRLQPSIDMDEAKFIYDKVAKGNAGAVLFEDIQILLKDSGINLTTFLVGQTNLPRKVQTTLLDSSKPRDSPKAQQLIQKLRARIDAKNYDLRTVFTAYDRDKDQLLSLEQFSKLMAKIDQQSSKIDIEICFNVFDKENRGYITFGDFKQVVANEIGSKSQPARKMKSVPPPQPMRAPSVGRQIEI